MSYLFSSDAKAFSDMAPVVTGRIEADSELYPDFTNCTDIVHL